MRLWSLHLRYLDSKGLVALWREGLLARAVLRGESKGYRRHPQLQRFRERGHPVASIEAYLHAVLEEARSRGYRFDATKLAPPRTVASIPVTSGQIRYEWSHLLSKLSRRDPERFRRLRGTKDPSPHPLMTVVPGDVEPWEVVR